MDRQEIQAVTLKQYTQRISGLFASEDSLRDTWITAETADVRTTGGNCYLELVEKDPESGQQLAKMRANIWRSAYYNIAGKFLNETGRPFGSDLKVMVRVSANFHPVYGLSVTITDINSAFTLGDVIQRRNRLIRRLQQEGIIDMNRQLQWPLVPQRIAVISASGAAGYGDFINQLYGNTSHLRFETRLFPALLQGDRAPASIIAALDLIAQEYERWDGVVIIRGGGSTHDLLSFDDYDLAANIAQFPLPVIIGIGHERDVSLLDYVANMRVKTPTAAAEWLIERGERMLGNLVAMASSMLQAVTDRLKTCHTKISYAEGVLPTAATNALMRANRRLADARFALASVSERKIRPGINRLDSFEEALKSSLKFALANARNKLDAKADMVKVLSPEATLKRGYSITRVGGKAITDCNDVDKGEIIETILATGKLYSQVK